MVGTGTPMSCVCGCAHADGDEHHRIADALARDDVDAALSLGLLTVLSCASCADDCRARLDRVRHERRTAMAARERYRARAERLARRAAERDARRPPSAPGAATQVAPALSGAAAAALARAKARAAGRREP